MNKKLILWTLLLTASSLLSLCSFIPYPQQNQQQTANWRNIDNNAFTTGEKLEFRLHYGILNAGNVTMEIKNELKTIDGRPTFHIVGNGTSHSSFDWMFKVRDKFESYVDTQSILPLKFVKDQQEGSYKDNDYVSFNYGMKQLFNKKGSKAIPENLQDVISLVYYARTIDLKNAKMGQIFPVNLYMDNEIYSLNFKYDGKEVLKTDLGKINAIRIIPQVVADRVFKDKDAMKIWVSDDENKMPLRIQADVLIGSIKCDIKKYEGIKHDLNKK